MENLLYMFALALVLIWSIGFIGFHADGLIHFLLILAVGLIVIKALTGKYRK